MSSAVGVTAVSKVSTGNYRVTFERPILGCLFNATSTTAPGYILPSEDKTYTVAVTFEEDSMVSIISRSASTAALADADFQLAAFCPK